ncbi:FAD-dependent monooxygenase [bacterium RCC_150]
MGQPSVLVCGAGIAGATLAFWLTRHGFRPTVLERSQRLRSSGSPVDVHGKATEVARRMGVLPRLREAATDAPGLIFVTPSGLRIGPLRLGRPRGEDLEVPRADLAGILADAVRDDAEFLFGDTLTSLNQDDGGVDATFQRAAPRRFDLVVGADGLHSAVRSMVFGAEEHFVRHLGLYIATMSLGCPATEPSAVVMYNRPGLSLTVHPVRGTAGAGFIFRSQPRPGLDYRDIRTQQGIVLDAYGKHDWQVPELPDLRNQVSSAEELYFDSISQVRLPKWSKGRVTLLGDAASCVSLFGDGSSLAMTGAVTLAEALAATPGNPDAAFRIYEDRHRKQTKARQRGHFLAAALLVPATPAALNARNLAVRLLPD